MSFDPSQLRSPNAQERKADDLAFAASREHQSFRARHASYFEFAGRLDPQTGEPMIEARPDLDRKSTALFFRNCDAQKVANDVEHEARQARRKMVCEWLASATLFHGTDEPDVHQLVSSVKGTLGPGIYFTADQESAAVYGDVVYCAQARITRPWVIELDHDSKAATKEDFDSPCVEAILSLPLGRELLDEVKRSGELHFGPKLQAHLRSYGYDGIVGAYEDGSLEIVVFDQTNVEVLGVSPAQRPSVRQLA